MAMSLHSHHPAPVPEEPARVARTALPRGSRYMRMRDESDTIYVDDTFAALFPRRGQPAESPWRLAVVTVFQFAEGLSDREAAGAVRSRIDWKYARSLELADAGFVHGMLHTCVKHSVSRFGNDRSAPVENRNVTEEVDGRRARSASWLVVRAVLDGCRDQFRWLSSDRGGAARPGGPGARRDTVRGRGGQRRAVPAVCAARAP